MVRKGDFYRCISIHALREEGDLCDCQRAAREAISIHALREEGDFSTGGLSIGVNTFLSTPSARRATAIAGILAELKEFLSTPSARRATGAVPASRSPVMISIHALREEGDAKDVRPAQHLRLFLSTPSARRATLALYDFMDAAVFLSTPSARRATRPRWKARRRSGNFYPRPPRGGRLSSSLSFRPPTSFLSTPSARRATSVRAGLTERR